MFICCSSGLIRHHYLVLSDGFMPRKVGFLMSEKQSCPHMDTRRVSPASHSDGHTSATFFMPSSAFPSLMRSATNWRASFSCTHDSG